MLSSGTAEGAEVLSDVRPFREPDTTTVAVGTIVNQARATQAGGGTADASAERRPGNAQALDPRAAGRRIAAMTPAHERAALYAEHQQLAIKKVTESLTAAEERRLKLVSWNIDRIEDADYGPEADALELRANMLEKLATNVQGFVTEARKRQRR
jgi:hypothetical protein